MIDELTHHNLTHKLRFRRFEFKYHLPEFMVDRLVCDLFCHMDWDPYALHQTDNAYQVSSLYFDTFRFGCYHQKLAGLKHRKKLRLRTYAGNLCDDSPVFVEVKRKNDAIILKDRFVSNYHDCLQVLNDGSWDALLSNGNKELIEKILCLYRYNCLMPKVMVTYRRMPLIGRIDHQFRVTFDLDIRALFANHLTLEQGMEVAPGMVVMELKCNNSIPYWFHQIIQKYQLNRGTFSKYCQSLEALWNHYGHN